ncbi:hypothetical protein CL634_03210 [bacterium]|nr:hypothetical protein [bacterium]
MSELAFHLPINAVSFGQISINLLREAYKRGLEPSLFPIGQVPDLSTENEDKEFEKWINTCIRKGLESHSRKTPVFKLWHLNGSLESFSEKQTLLTFYEVDQPTSVELNVAKNNAKVLFTSKYTCEIFNNYGINSEFIGLGFDSNNFSVTDRDYFNDRITFNLVGKLEKRKHHEKIIRAWVKKFGNDKNFYLNCAIFNSFLSPEQNSGFIEKVLEGKKYFNINLLGFMPKNSLYNDFLNSGDIVIGMSGGEGWGLPEFQSVGLGKHAIVLNAHAYKEWANEKNAVIVNPSKKIPAYDGMFFKPNQPWNQGNIFDFDENDFIEGCEKAIERVKNNKINLEGLKLQEKFSYSKMFDKVLEFSNVG